MQSDVDVVIAGAGMAGLVAGITAAESGASVMVLEKGNRAGGTMYVSGGIVWTVDSVERAQERVPKGRRLLHQLVVDQLPAALDWLVDHGVQLHEPSSKLPGPGKAFDSVATTDRLVHELETLGGRVLLESPLEDVTTDPTGSVNAAHYRTEGTTKPIATRNVVLATGGFQGNERLVQQFITDAAEHMLLRANPWSTGDGLTIATARGGKLTTGLGTFYGHSLPAPPAQFTQSELREVSQFYGPWTVVLNQDGERFTDESKSPLEELLVQDIAKHANGRAWYVFDHSLYESTISTNKSVKAHVDRAINCDGRVGRHSTIDALCATLDDWGVNGSVANETIAQYTEAIQTGRGAELDPPRSEHQIPIDHPPFFAVEVRPGITFTMGGIHVNERMAVTHQPSSSTSLTYHPETAAERRYVPIPGLFAAGVDVGNFNHERYLGGLGFALVTGLIAGDEAAKQALNRDRHPSH